MSVVSRLQRIWYILTHPCNEYYCYNPKWCRKCVHELECKKERAYIQ